MILMLSEVVAGPYCARTESTGALKEGRLRIGAGGSGNAKSIDKDTLDISGFEFKRVETVHSAIC